MRLRVYTTTPYPELCKGLYHHNAVWHESSRPQIHRGFDHRRERRRLEYASLTPTLRRR